MLGGLRITPDQLFVLGLTPRPWSRCTCSSTRTTLGRAMRATSHNPTLARVTGIDVDGGDPLRPGSIGAALAAVAGVFAGLTVQLRPSMGFDLLLPLFAAAILGGIGSVLRRRARRAASSASPRACRCRSIGAEYRAAAAFLVLIAILLVRPDRPLRREALMPERCSASLYLRPSSWSSR